MVGPMVPDRRPRAEEEVKRSDRRWFLAALLVFTGSVGALFGAREVFRATGPHPEVTLFVRRLKSYANRLLRQRVRRR